jgi:hypothetical protein
MPLASMGILAPCLRTLDGVAYPPLTQAELFTASVCKPLRSHMKTLSQLFKIPPFVCPKSAKSGRKRERKVITIIMAHTLSSNQDWFTFDLSTHQLSLIWGIGYQFQVNLLESKVSELSRLYRRRLQRRIQRRQIGNEKNKNKTHSIPYQQEFQDLYVHGRKLFLTIAFLVIQRLV